MNTNDLLTIIEHIPAVVMRLSHQEDIWSTWFITHNISVYGYTQEDFISNSVRWMDVVHPDDRVLLSKTIADYEAHSINSYKLYYRLLKKNGDSVPVTEYNTVNRDEAGNILYYDTVIFNNSQADEGLRIIDAHYRQQVVLNDILISLHDSDLDHALQIILDRTGAYLNTSRAMLFQDSPDHNSCKIIYEWCNQDIGSVMALDYSIAYRSGIPEIYIALQTTGNLLIHFGEIPENCREEFAAEDLIASAIFAVYLEGEHYGFVCFDDCVVERRWDDDTARFLKNIANIVSTVLSRQRAAEKLAQNRRTYEAVLNNVDSYIFVTEVAGREIIFANRAFCDAFAGDCIGKDASAYLELGRGANHNLADANSGTIHYSEIYCEHTREWLAVSAEEITWIDGRRVRLFNYYDITAKKHFAHTLEEKIEERTGELRLMTQQAEDAKVRAEEAASAKTLFLANMSHEMRTPMNAIIGMTNIYKTAKDDGRRAYCLEKIEEASVHLLGVINDILDMSKIEAGKMELHHSEFNFEKMLIQVTNVLQYSIGQKEQLLHVKTDENLPAYLRSDEQRISQVITNLLSNAVKFTPFKGEITLAVRQLSQTAETCVIEVAVRDNGIGISQEQMGKLFSTFEQADAGISRKYGGTGLGLSISANIASLLNGEITVDSQPGKGSTFLFTFEAQRSAKQPRLQKAIDFRQLPILVVDGTREVQDTFLHLSQSYGFACNTAATGEAALQILQRAAAPYHMVFVDWHLQDMPVTQFVERARRHSDSFVIMATAFEWSEIQQDAKAAGVEHFISKPLYPSVILETFQQRPRYTVAANTEDRDIHGAFAGRRILLAEDVAINREIVLAILEPTGLEIDCAKNGKEAVAMFAKKQAYDMIFMDIHMPEVDGYQATRQIRALPEDTAKKIPIIAMTANVFREDIERCLACGMNDHLGKPLDIDEVFAKLQQYLQLQ